MNLKTILTQFISYLDEEINSTKQRLPYSCCMSTIGIDGFPNARFVLLKKIRKVALTFWWSQTQHQVRVQGILSRSAVDGQGKAYPILHMGL